MPGPLRFSPSGAIPCVDNELTAGASPATSCIARDALVGQMPTLGPLTAHSALYSVSQNCSQHQHSSPLLPRIGMPNGVRLSVRYMYCTVEYRQDC